MADKEQQQNYGPPPGQQQQQYYGPPPDQQQPQYYGPPPVQQQPQPPPVNEELQDKTQRLATAAIVMGVCFLPSFAGLCSLVAIVLGAIACHHASNRRATEGDRQLACVGVVLGAIGFIGFVAWIIFMIMTFAIVATTTERASRYEHEARYGPRMYRALRMQALAQADLGTADARNPTLGATVDLAEDQTNESSPSFGNGLNPAFGATAQWNEKREMPNESEETNAATIVIKQQAKRSLLLNKVRSDLKIERDRARG